MLASRSKEEGMGDALRTIIVRVCDLESDRRSAAFFVTIAERIEGKGLRIDRNKKRVSLKEALEIFPELFIVDDGDCLIIADKKHVWGVFDSEKKTQELSLILDAGGRIMIFVDRVEDEKSEELLEKIAS